jgi:hypothetical protein
MRPETKVRRFKLHSGRQAKTGQSAEDRLAEALAGAYMAMAGQDAALAAELVRGSEYLKGEAA